MNNISVYIDEKSISSKNNLVTGIISLKIDDIYYPEREWNDFSVVILQWWLESYITLLSDNRYSTFTFRFMDGPFGFYISTRKNDMLCELNFFNTNPAVDFYEINKIEFFRSIILASKKVLDICYSNHWSSNDIERLAAFYNRASSIEKQFPK